VFPFIWRSLSLVERYLTDEQFLHQFEPLVKGFRAREPYLACCARTLADLYDPLAGCRVLVPASGCDVLPSMLRRLGCDAVGQEVAGTLPVRYCRIKGFPLLLSKDWISAWTDAEFDLVVVTSYVTNPGSSDWAGLVTERFCENVFQHVVKRGAELVLFDLRYDAPLTAMIRSRSWPIEREFVGGGAADVALFFRHGADRSRFRPLDGASAPRRRAVPMRSRRQTLQVRLSMCRPTRACVLAVSILFEFLRMLRVSPGPRV
jgi:hypothetical protein